VIKLKFDLQKLITCIFISNSMHAFIINSAKLNNNTANNAEKLNNTRCAEVTNK